MNTEQLRKAGDQPHKPTRKPKTRDKTNQKGPQQMLLRCKKGIIHLERPERADMTNKYCKKFEFILNAL